MVLLWFCKDINYSISITDAYRIRVTLPRLDPMCIFHLLFILCFSFIKMGKHFQVASRMHKFDGHGNGNPNRNNQAHHRNGPRRRLPAANGAPYPPPMHYPQHPGQPIFYPVVPSPMILQEYSYQPFPIPVPNHDRHVGKSGYENSLPPFVPVDQVGAHEGNRPMPPHPRGDPHLWRPPVGTHGTRPHPGPEGHGHYGQAWQNPQMFGTRENTSLPQGLGPRAFVRPMVPLGYINGPPYPGNALFTSYDMFGIWIFLVFKY